MELPDVTLMEGDELMKYAEGLQEALVPFAHAGLRVRHYGSPPDDTMLYADGDNTLYELLAFDPDVIEDPQEDCRQLEVSDLIVAGYALRGKKGE